MNINYYVKCNVCGSVTRMRLQVGWLKEHPVHIYCGKCGILLEGKVVQDQENIKVGIAFKNAVQTDEDSDFFIEASGEFPSCKMMEDEGMVSSNTTLSPFIRYSQMPNQHLFNKYSSYMIQYHYEEWANIRNVFQLWANSESNHYLVSELRKNKINVKQTYEDINEGIHQLFGKVADGLINLTGYQEICGLLNTISNLDREELERFYLFLKEKNVIPNYRRRIYEMLDQFIAKFPNLIPAYRIFFSEQNYSYEKEGITTTSFELVKGFYIDCYELLGDMIPIIIGLNNIYYRNNYEEMVPINVAKNKGLSLEDLFYKPNPTKVKYFTSNEVFSNALKIDFNYEMRNSIGHYDYCIDGMKQEIHYHKSTDHSIDHEEYLGHVYLLEFTVKCIELFQKIVYMESIIYSIESKSYQSIYSEREGEDTFYGRTLKGHQMLDLASMEAFNMEMPKQKEKKVYRNDKCPCGSGKKYKFCHGK